MINTLIDYIYMHIYFFTLLFFNKKKKKHCILLFCFAVRVFNYFRRKKAKHQEINFLGI